MRQSFIDVLRSSADEQRALFFAAASDLETRAENIEKDLYGTVTLTEHRSKCGIWWDDQIYP